MTEDSCLCERETEESLTEKEIVLNHQFLDWLILYIMDTAHFSNHEPLMLLAKKCSGSSVLPVKLKRYR